MRRIKVGEGLGGGGVGQLAPLVHLDTCLERFEHGLRISLFMFRSLFNESNAKQNVELLLEH